MNLRASAERILFGGSLEDKLGAISLEDSRPGEGIRVPAAPVRAPGFGVSQARVAFPRDLGSVEARGRVLHFFANHELLAIELIALALLRFPDADPGWRRGLGAILGQEQDHLRGYIERLEAAGAAFGEQALNGYFWSALSGVQTAEQFTAGLSLTFEQANLDFACHFASRMRAVGDEDTALLLDRVLADEIEHVAHGVRWLRTWQPGDFWTTWTALLAPPLTPARAKGSAFHAAPRRAAGIPDDVIERLRVFSASKGRPPVVGWFVPDVESTLVGARTAPGIAEDLATLPMFLLGADDHVLASTPDSGWLGGLQSLGFRIPGFGLDVPERVGGWLPWGWSPGVCQRAGVAWDPRWRDLYDKGWLQRRFGHGNVATTEAEIGALGAPGWVLKAPFSTAGRGLMRWEAPDRVGWARRVLREQGAVVVEPWAERVVDISVQFDVSEGGVKIHPWGRFLVDGHGRYQGAVVGRPLDGLAPELIRWIRERDVQAELEVAIRPVAAEMHARGVRGFAGIDAYIFRAEGGLQLRPLVELNPRVTMGRIAQAVGRRVRRECPAELRVVTVGKLRGEGREPAEWLAEMQALPTPKLREGLIEDGVVMLTEPKAGRRAWVVLGVGAGTVRRRGA